MGDERVTDEDECRRCSIEVYDENRTFSGLVDHATVEDRWLLMVKALETVDWVDGSCPWCQGVSPEDYDSANTKEHPSILNGMTRGHKPDCLRQRALGVSNG
jgi:hypothetical protein